MRSLLSSMLEFVPHDRQLQRTHTIRLSGIIVLSFNTLIPEHSFIAEKLEKIFILPFFPSTRNYVYRRISVDNDEY